MLFAVFGIWQLIKVRSTAAHFLDTRAQYPLPELREHKQAAVAQADCNMRGVVKLRLLDLDDHLLCEVFKSLSVRGKQNNVQLTCLRFRSVLQRPSIVETWVRVTVKLLPDTGTSPQRITQLIAWLMDRKSGE
jgi:hypothetical protein